MSTWIKFCETPCIFNKTISLFTNGDPDDSTVQHEAQSITNQCVNKTHSNHM